MTKIELIASIKADLVAKGVNLTGPCGAFEITKRVAWALRDEGIGLVAKNAAQNGCDANGERYAIDALMMRDGQTFDILVNGGGEERNGVPIPGTGNDPAWQVTGAAPRDSWRAPFDVDRNVDPGPDPGPIPGPGPEPAPTPGSVSRADIERILAAQAADTARILAAIQELRREASDLGKTLLPQLIAALAKRPG
jgi:hypothetical protein